VYTSKILNYCL